MSNYSFTLCPVRYDVKVKVVNHPQTNDIHLAKVLQALSDPVRLRLVGMLATQKDLPCSALCLGRPKSSMSHHFKMMIDAGLLRVDVVGNVHVNNLRMDDLESRFPGLLLAVLRASEKTDPVTEEGVGDVMRASERLPSLGLLQTRQRRPSPSSTRSRKPPK